MSLEQPALFDYGIHNEASDIRAHVGMVVKKVYVFSTADGRRAMEAWKKDGNTVRPAYQPNVSYATAVGYPVPWDKIANIRLIQFPPEDAISYFHELSTTEKGKIAVDIVASLLKKGRFPLWIEGLECQDRELNISGTDITVRGKWRIQVKCDAKCGERELGGSGNLYLQTMELNPHGLK